MATSPAELEQLVANDPELKAVFDQMKTAPAYQVPQFAAQLDALFKAKGVDATLPEGYGWGADGKIHQQAFMNRHDKLLTALSLAPAALGVGSALAGGGAAATGGTGAAAGGAGTAATTAATAATGGSLLHSLLPTIIGAGASLGGTAIASHANSEAAKIAAAQADKALQVQEQQYALQRQDTAPYLALGQGAVNNLGFLSGIDTTSNLKALSDINPTVNPPPSTGVAPGAVDASGKPIPGAPPTSSITPPTMAQQQTNNRTLSQVGGGGTVRIQDPQTGLIHLIPQSDAAAAQQAGGRLV